MAQVELLRQFFFNRTDAVANLAHWHKPCPVHVSGEDQLAAFLRAHVKGDKVKGKHFSSRGPLGTHAVGRVGSYVPGADSMTRWICIDFDGGAGKRYPLEDPLLSATYSVETAKAAGAHPYLERSGGGRGWHVWLFLAEPMEALRAKEVGFGIVPHDALLIGGDRADPHQNQGIEVFPKAVEMRDDNQLGNLVWLPWWHGAAEGCSEFYRNDKPWRPRNLRTTDKQALRKLWKPLNLEEKKEATAERGDKWDRWKQAAFDALDLSRIFNLTGKKAGRGWLEARCPDGEDKDPSACVSDGTVAQRALFKSYRTGWAGNPLDYLMKYGGVSFYEAAKMVERFSGVKMPDEQDALQAPANPPNVHRDDDDGEESDGRVWVNVTADERDIADASWRALLSVPDREQTLFRWAGSQLVRVVDSADGPIAQPVTSAVMRRLLIDRVRYFKHGSQRDNFARRPEKVAATTVAVIRESPPATLGELRGVTSAPVFVRHGSKPVLLRTPGYDRRSGVYVSPQLDVPPVPETPSADDLGEAYRWIFGRMMADFPFSGEASFAHAVAALIQPFVRSLIDGPTPLYVYEAPTEGTGKSLLAKCTKLVFSGSTATSKLSANEEESEKKLTSALRESPNGVILFDNVRSTLNSELLEALITSQEFEGRVLGFSQRLPIRNNATWLLTSNNPNANSDTMRRMLSTRLDSGMENPSARNVGTMAVQNLEHWARTNRGKLVWSVLVLVQHWVANGAKLAPLSFGSFEHYAAVVGGVLQSHEIDGFLAGRNDRRGRDHDEWIQFFEAWWEVFEGRGVRTTALYQQTVGRDADLLLTVLGPGGGETRAVRLGRALGRRVGKPYGSFVLNKDGRFWVLSRVSSEK